MKRCVSLTVLLSAVIVCLPSAGLAINSGAHIYVAEQVFGSDDIDLLYGSIAPDLSTYVPNPQEWETGFMDTHYNYIVLKPQGWTEPWKRFMLGWMTHNEEWGADWYSHIEYQYPGGQIGNGYVIDKALMLAPLIPVYDPDLAISIAHSAIEFAIDLLTQEYLDPDLGVKLSMIAVNRSDEDVRRLFNILVAKNKVTNRETLLQSEMIFRNLIFMYSQALATSTVDNLVPLAHLGSSLAQSQYGVEIPWENVRDLLQFAVFLCSGDFDDFLGDTINGIKAELGMN